jgi:predicted nuclease with RNAse H fold
VPTYRAFAIAVLRIEDGRIVEVTAFHDPRLFPAFAPCPGVAIDAPMSFCAIRRLNRGKHIDLDGG